jgi:hypothetical protein
MNAATLACGINHGEKRGIFKQRLIIVSKTKRIFMPFKMVVNAYRVEI